MEGRCRAHRHTCAPRFLSAHYGPFRHMMMISPLGYFVIAGKRDRPRASIPRAPLHATPAHASFFAVDVARHAAMSRRAADARRLMMALLTAHCRTDVHHCQSRATFFARPGDAAPMTRRAIFGTLSPVISSAVKLLKAFISRTRARRHYGMPCHRFRAGQSIVAVTIYGRMCRVNYS